MYPVDIIGSIYRNLGIDAEARLPHPMGLATHVIPSASEDKDVKSGGLLKELT